jgi:cytochrome P450
MCEMYVPQRSRETEDGPIAPPREFGAFLTAHIEDHRHNGADDLLSALIAVRDTGEKLSDAELISTCVLLLNAGHEATVHQTGNAVKTILDQGAIRAGFSRRLSWLRPASRKRCALMRRCTCSPATPMRRFDLGPVTLKPGEQVALLLGAANRDPSAFDAPHEFRPGRPDQKNVSFGAGLHFCIGAPLARLELQESLSVLFERMPEMKLETRPRYRDSYHFHGLESLVVR